MVASNGGRTSNKGVEVPNWNLANVISLAAISVLCVTQIGHAAKPVDSSDIVAFANNPFFSYNTGDIYQKMSKSKLVKFLQEGKRLEVTAQPGDKRLRGSTQFHEPLTPEQRRWIQADRTGGGSINANLVCQGVAVAGHDFFFWRAINDNVIWISDSQGPGYYLRLN